jgi:hypothetical protein
LSGVEMKNGRAGIPPAGAVRVHGGVSRIPPPGRPHKLGGRFP